ncbi:hypothetical protein BC833DRAFT_569827 [Globomyces pollinis-pini]|nr:hypothetical protein BC833DRAFT_569827 [Globomyces pollinis-pini]
MRQPRNMRIVRNNLNQPAADPDVIAFEANENLQLLKGLKTHKQHLGYWNSYRKFIYENANELQQNIHNQHISTRVVSDSAFPVSDNLFKRIEIPLKTGDIDKIPLLVQRKIQCYNCY